MALADHVETYECPDCGEEITSREKVAHGYEHDEWPFADIFPEYYVCGDSVDSENFTPVYLKVPREDGPFYMAYGDGRDYVDEVDAYELMRHEWEYVAREDTPFPEFEDASVS